MDAPALLEKLSLRDKSFSQLINIIFALFFLFPVIGFILLSMKYHMLEDRDLLIFFFGVLVFSFLGLFILRRIFDSLSTIARTRAIHSDVGDRDGPAESSAGLDTILETFTALEKRFSNTFSELQRKSTEVSMLKELSDLCSVSFDRQEILSVTLERAIILAGADVGSIMLVDDTQPETLVVKAAAGTPELPRIRERQRVEGSVAGLALLDKSPVLVADIEQEERFAVRDMPHRQAVSCVCMPLRTSRETVGVLALSRRAGSHPFSTGIVETLAPLMNSAAFAYDNLQLYREKEHARRFFHGVGKMCSLASSDSRAGGFLRALLLELKTLMPFEVAIVMTLEEKNADTMKVVDLLMPEPAALARGESFSFDPGDVIDRIIRQESALVLKTGDRLPLLLESIVSATQLPAVVLPLKVNDAVSGLLLLTLSDLEIWRENRTALPSVVNLIAIGMERARLSRAVARRDRELATIKHIGSALASSTFDLKQVLKYTMDMIRVAINVETGFLFLVKGSKLEFAVGLNVETAPLKNRSLRLGQGIAGYVTARGESITINDVSNTRHFFPEIDEAAAFITRSVLCVPMISQGKVIGVLEVLNKLDGAFSASDEDLVGSIAASVSIAIENAHLYREMVSMAENERSIRRMFQKFVPKKVVDKIIHNGEGGKSLVEEFKTVTLLNIDIRGFSELSRKLGPQRTVSLLNFFFSVMGEIVFRHQGIVDKYLGDGFLALFGAPVSSAHDADNGVRAALEMRDALARINRRLRGESGFQLKVGISLHTGQVVVGNIGFDMKMDYTVIGEAVNDVFWLQDLTRSVPNGILISENTYMATGLHLTVSPFEGSPEACSLKNPMKIYRLTAATEDYRTLPASAEKMPA
jgi:class 3 adenylate cyclase/putative methionine-R-sulfoxide reductase with GAF domain